MRRHSIMPTQWNLSVEEAQRIVAAGVRISIYNTPASCLPLAMPIEGGLKHLIVVDPALLDSGKFAPRHMIASFLHEIGHAVNPPIKGSFGWDYMMHLNQVNEDEIFADDYARHCGNGIDFAEALDLMRQFEPRSFDTKAVEYRIERIRSNAQVYLNLLPIADAPN